MRTVIGRRRPTLNVDGPSSARRKLLPSHPALASSYALIVIRPIINLMGCLPMDFCCAAKLFGDLLAFVYHCFDRIVIHSFSSAPCHGPSRWCMLSFRQSRRRSRGQQGDLRASARPTTRNWVEAFARNHHTPIKWAERGVRKEDYVLPWLRRMTNKNAYGVYLIFKSMEQGPSLPHQRAGISPPRTRISPHPRPPAQPLHPLLFLHPR